MIGYLELGEIKVSNLKNVDFEKKSPKSEKKQQKNKKKAILHFKTTLNNVALKLEIGFELQGCLRPL